LSNGDRQTNRQTDRYKERMMPTNTLLLAVQR